MPVNAFTDCPLCKYSEFPSTNRNNSMGTSVSFQFRNEQFSARSRKTRGCAEAYRGTSHKRSRSLTPRLRKRAIYGWKLARIGRSFLWKDPLIEAMDQSGVTSSGAKRRFRHSPHRCSLNAPDVLITPIPYKSALGKLMEEESSI